MSAGIAAAVGIAGCGGDGGDAVGDRGDAGGDDGTAAEQGPSDRSASYLDVLSDYYPECSWRTIDGAMDESSQTLYTASFGAMAESTVEPLTSASTSSTGTSRPWHRRGILPVHDRGLP